MRIRRGRSLRAVLAGSLVLGTVVVGTTIVGAVPASATTPTIVNCNVPGVSLQTAINDAALAATLVVHGTCTGNFTISQNLTLQGSGTLSGTGSNGPVLIINNGIVAVNNLTIKNGDNTSVDAGGGIFNDRHTDPHEHHRVGQQHRLRRSHLQRYGATLTLTNSTLSGNTASTAAVPSSTTAACEHHEQHHVG